MSGNSSVGRASASQVSDFKELSKAYLEHRVAEGKRRASYTHLWNVWQPALGRLAVKEITTADVVHWLNHYHDKRSWSAQTKLHCINILSGFFRWAIQQGHAEVNPCARVPRPKVQNERRFVISKEQLSSLLSRLPTWCRDLIIVAALTGLRFGKLTALKPSDLRQDEEGDWFLECLDKNGELHRAFLYGVALETCRRRALRGSQWLFTGTRGGQLTQQTVRRHLIPAARSAGLEWGRSRYGFTFHSLRRAFASHLLSDGASLEEVMAAGNWKSYDAVKRYAYLSSKRKKASFKRLDKLI